MRYTAKRETWARPIGIDNNLRAPSRARRQGVRENFGYHIPYPVVNERSTGARLIDVDRNDYIDFAYAPASSALLTS